MKIRTDYVTNSSSSSFIVAKKGILVTKENEVSLSEEVIKYIRKVLEEQLDYTTKISTIEELIDWFTNEEGYSNLNEYLRDTGDYGREKYLKCKNAIEEGYTLLFGTIATDDEELSMVGVELVGLALENLGKNYIHVEGDGSF